MKNDTNMTYDAFHNAQADLFAQRYYGLTYAECTTFMQLIVDEQIVDAWDNIPFAERASLQG
jgi:hypothetical protein